MDYTLTDDQRQIWRDLLKPYLHAEKKARREKLENKLQGVAGKKLKTWRSRLADFRQGKEPGLRAVFESTKALRIVTEALDIRLPESLQGFLDQAKSEATEQGTIFVPGYEDLGPLPARTAYLPPAITGSNVASVKADLSPLSVKTLDALIQRPPSAEGALGVLFHVRAGFGQSSTLAYASSLLRQEGARLTSLAATETRAILVVDDLDRLPPKKREATIRAAEQRHLTLFAAVNDPLHYGFGGGARRVRLEVSGRNFGIAFLKHANTVLTERRGAGAPIESVLSWIRDDELASALFARADILGLMVRTIEDTDGEVKASEILDRLPTTAVRVACERLRSLGKITEAALLDAIGPNILRRFGSRPASGTRVMERVLKLAPSARPKPSPTLPLIAQMPQALVDGGILRRDENGYFAAKPMLAAMQRGSTEFSVSDAPPGIIENLARGAHTGDLGPSIKDLFADPPRLWRSIQMLTIFLASGQSCGDNATFRTAFVAALSWWARRHDLQATGLAGTSPLSLLAQASRGRLDLLADLDADAIVSPRDPAGWNSVLDLAAEPPSPERAATLLALSAPSAQRLRLLWPKLRPDGPQTPIPHVIEGVQVNRWWVRYASKALRAVAQQDRGARQVLAGTDEKATLPWNANLGWKGQFLRVEFLDDAIRRREPRAGASFSEALGLALAFQRGDLTDKLLETWDRVHTDDRPAFRVALLERLPRLTLEPEGGARNSWIKVLREILSEVERDALWESWLLPVPPAATDVHETPEERLARIAKEVHERCPASECPKRPQPKPERGVPWRLWLGVGMEPAKVLDAALARGEGAIVAGAIAPEALFALLEDDSRAHRLAQVEWLQRSDLKTPALSKIALRLAAHSPIPSALLPSEASAGEGDLWAAVARALTRRASQAPDSLAHMFDTIAQCWTHAIQTGNGERPKEALEAVTDLAAKHAEFIRRDTGSAIRILKVIFEAGAEVEKDGTKALLRSWLRRPSWRSSVVPSVEVMGSLVHLVGRRRVERAVIRGLGNAWTSEPCRAVQAFAEAASLAPERAVTLVTACADATLPSLELRKVVRNLLSRDPRLRRRRRLEDALLRLLGARLRSSPRDADPLGVEAAAALVREGRTAAVVSALKKARGKGTQLWRRAIFAEIGEREGETLLRAWTRAR